MKPIRYLAVAAVCLLVAGAVFFGCSNMKGATIGKSPHPDEQLGTNGPVGGPVDTEFKNQLPASAAAPGIQQRDDLAKAEKYERQRAKLSDANDSITAPADVWTESSAKDTSRTVNAAPVGQTPLAAGLPTTSAAGEMSVLKHGFGGGGVGGWRASVSRRHGFQGRCRHRWPLAAAGFVAA